ncbi:MAG: bifunctional nuclease family protein [Puniceicoccales bacterium]|jgi:bifunctional DNase/RNase|nr:bifunctional nuclease family protein [Puniceicoccales bacterium]
MKIKLLPVSLSNIVETPNGASVFFSSGKKVFVIHMARSSGDALMQAVEGEQKERPLTHDLVNSIFRNMGIHVVQVVLHKEEDGVFFTRLVLGMKNEIGTKIVEIDARPSDSLVLAAWQKRPVFITQELFDKLDDVSKMLEKIIEPK